MHIGRQGRNAKYAKEFKMLSKRKERKKENEYHRESKNRIQVEKVSPLLILIEDVSFSTYHLSRIHTDFCTS